MLRTLLILGRVSNLPTVWTNVLAGWFFSGGAWSWELLWIEIAVSLLYVAGMTLNDAFDAGWDRQHAPERPIPSGAIAAGNVWMIGIGQMAAGVALLLLATNVAWIWAVALVGAILLYDAIHKKTTFSVLAMGACRGLVYLLAGSAVNSEKLGWWWAIGSMVYVVGITVVARSERKVAEGKVSLFSPVEALLFVPFLAVWLAMPPDLSTRFMALVSMVPLGAWVARALVRKRKTGAIGPMVGALIAGIVLMDASFLFLTNANGAALLAVLLLPVTVLFQRRIPAT